MEPGVWNLQERALDAVTQARPRWNYLVAWQEHTVLIRTPCSGSEGRLREWTRRLLPGDRDKLHARWQSLFGTYLVVTDPERSSEEAARVFGERADQFAAWLECDANDLLLLLDACRDPEAWRKPREAKR